MADNRQPESSDAASRTKTRDPLVGTTLDGRYHIDDVLGQGGMSVVYKATQLRVNRLVAIKTLKFQIEEKPILRERFEREITSLCALSHPNVVTVYDCVIGDDEQPYVVMDYLRGHSLEALIRKEGPLPIDRFASIAVQICSALDHAHRKGIVHRDLKPGNVVLMDDETDFVKVVDFGLAQLAQEGKKLTNTGELWGSPPYMSPEQCKGEPTDERSDIYSLGAVMFEMLAGDDPFSDASTIFEFINKHVNVPPPSIQSVYPTSTVSPEVEAVIFKCMAKKVEDRFATAATLQDALIKACSKGIAPEARDHLSHIATQTRARPVAQSGGPLEVVTAATPSNGNPNLNPNVHPDLNSTPTPGGGSFAPSSQANPPGPSLPPIPYEQSSIPSLDLAVKRWARDADQAQADAQQPAMQSGSYDTEEEGAVEYCQTCGKAICRPGRMTSWFFKESRCQCPSPIAGPKPDLSSGMKRAEAAAPMVSAGEDQGVKAENHAEAARALLRSRQPDAAGGDLFGREANYQDKSKVNNLRAAQTVPPAAIGGGTGGIIAILSLIAAGSIYWAVTVTQRSAAPAAQTPSQRGSSLPTSTGATLAPGAARPDLSPATGNPKHRPGMPASSTFTSSSATQPKDGTRSEHHHIIKKATPQPVIAHHPPAIQHPPAAAQPKGHKPAHTTAAGSNTESKQWNELNLLRPSKKSSGN